MINFAKVIPEDERITSSQAHMLREYYWTKGVGWANAQKWLMLVAPHMTKRDASKEIFKMKQLRAYGKQCIPTDYDESLIN